jgi:hypothetical protein
MSSGLGNFITYPEMEFTEGGFGVGGLGWMGGYPLDD